MIFKKIKKDQLKFRKEKDAIRAKVLTTLIGELQTKAIKEGTKEVTDSLCLATIKKFLDGNKEMMAVKPSEDLAIEAETLMVYMPKQMTESELEAVIVNYITDEEIEKSPKNIGKVMGFLKGEYPSMYDASVASKIVKDYLM